jgi:hypothetical protein
MTEAVRLLVHVLKNGSERNKVRGVAGDLEKAARSHTHFRHLDLSHTECLKATFGLQGSGHERTISNDTFPDVQHLTLDSASVLREEPISGTSRYVQAPNATQHTVYEPSGS